MSALACSGHMHLAVLADNGAFAGFLDIKNTVRLEITAQGGTEVNQTGYTHEGYGNVRSGFIVPGTPRLNLSMDDQGDKDVIEQHLLGLQSVLTQAGGAFTDESVVARLDRWVPIGTLRNLASAGLTVTTDPAGTTYDVDDDYIINPITGMIKALSGGAISDEEDLLVSGTSKAITGTRIVGGSRKFLRARVFFDGINLFNGRRVQISVPQVDLTPTNGMDFMQRGVGQSDFTGSPTALPGQAPFTVDDAEFAA